jgi:NodT family efflux transporter outer membrane factor (OMF) lipoprotein
MTKVSSLTARLLGASALALALAACTVGPDYQPPAPETRAGWQGRQETADFAQIQQWWAAFHDAELDSLVTRAIDGNLDVKMAAQRIVEARAQKDVAEAGYYPSITASSQASRTHIPTSLGHLPSGNTVDFFDVGPSLSWEIDLFGKTRRNVEAADAQVGASIEDRRAALVTLLGELGNDYAALRSAQARLDIAKRNIDAEGELVELTRAKQNGGLGSELDVAQAESQLSTLRAVIPQLETTIAQQGNAIAVLLGLEPGALTTELSHPGALPPAPPALPAALPSEVVLNRPDIREAERRLAAANAQIGVAEAARYPSLTLSPQIDLAGSTIHQMFSSTAALWVAMAGVKQPIFEGGKLDANVRSAEASTEEARLNYKKTVLTAFREIEDALVAYEAEQRRYKDLVAAREASRRALDRATSLYRAGLGDFLNVLDGERNLYTTEDAVAQSEQALTQQTVSLYKALGAGWQAGESAAQTNTINARDR